LGEGAGKNEDQVILFWMEVINKKKNRRRLEQGAKVAGWRPEFLYRERGNYLKGNKEQN